MAQPPVRADDPRFQLVPASAQAQGLLFALTVELPLVLVLVLPHAGLDANGPAIAADNPVMLKLKASLFLLAGLSALFVVLWLLMRRHRLVLDAAGLEVATTFYRRRLAWPQLRVEDARIVSLGERPELRPALKSNGYALPGFRSGWFRTRALAKVLAATAGGDRVLWVPTTEGYDLLLEPRNLQATLQRMRELATMAPGGPAG